MTRREWGTMIKALNILPPLAPPSIFEKQNGGRGKFLLSPVVLQQT
jgi:hypothetical protein